ncbi:hypothetical protein AX15_003935 [Amanita polypyramis BW_CC]|nr:hypothetical protein AX15_003935 [Amanita polypyramis BW_CC]
MKATMATIFRSLSIAANALCAGGLFTLPLLSPILAARLQFTQPQLTTVFLVGMISQYPLAPVVGNIVDRYGPRMCSLLAAIFHTLSFGGFASQVSADNADPLFSFRVLVFCSLLAGLGTVFSYYSSLFGASKSFPGYIGIASGTSMALFGLSPLFLTAAALRSFTDDSGNLNAMGYLLFLVALTGPVYLMGFFALSEPKSAIPPRNPEPESENTSLLSGTSEVSASQGTYRHEQCSPLNDLAFWLLFLFCICTLGAAEMIISNVGTLILALPKTTSFSANTTARQVQLLSLSNTVSRVITGFLADFMSPVTIPVGGVAVLPRKHFISRVFFLSCPSLLLALTFFWSSNGMKMQEDVWTLSIGVGTSYGAVFTVLPSIVSAIWGTRDLGRNFGILMLATFTGTSIFSYLYAFVSESHSKHGTICIGRCCCYYAHLSSMRRSWPLSTNPEFSVLECPGYCEYRIENWRLARDGSGKIITSASGLSWLDAFLAATFSFMWLKATHTWLVPAVGAISLYLWWKCGQILSESVVVLSSLGVQLETHWGSPFISRPLFTNRRFIPLCSLQDIIINEGLRRWDVRYYLALVNEKGPDIVSLEVAYENLLPYHHVLVYVYQCLQNHIPSAAPIHVTGDE